jgi:hypothetical protein
MSESMTQTQNDNKNNQTCKYLMIWFTTVTICFKIYRQKKAANGAKCFSSEYYNIDNLWFIYKYKLNMVKKWKQNYMKIADSVWSSLLTLCLSCCFNMHNVFP